MFVISSLQRIQVPYIPRAFLYYFLPFARLRIEEQKLVEVTVKFLPSILSFPNISEDVKTISWLQWTKSEADSSKVTFEAEEKEN